MGHQLIYTIHRKLSFRMRTLGKLVTFACCVRIFSARLFDWLWYGERIKSGFIPSAKHFFSRQDEHALRLWMSILQLLSNWHCDNFYEREKYLFVVTERKEKYSYRSLKGITTKKCLTGHASDNVEVHSTCNIATHMANENRSWMSFRIVSWRCHL